MRILVKSQDQNLNLFLPTNLVFSKAVAHLADGVGRKYAGDAMQGIPPEALTALFAEFRRIKRKYGKWDLVEVEASSGEYVLIRL